WSMPAHAQYCTADGDYCDEYISGVTVGTINNITSCGLVNGYSNYTAISTTMIAGQSYPITITNGYAWSGDEVYVWVDWNRNNSFADPGETFPLVTVNNAQTFTGTITVPVTV